MTKIAVMVSGSGTILRSMIEKNVPIALVLADKPCKGMEIAAESWIPAKLIDRRDFGYVPGIGDDWRRAGFTLAVARALLECNIDVVAMAGFFTVLDDVIFSTPLDGRILNTHPALLPAFKGATAVADTLAASVTESGCTVHIATEVLDDERYILGQERVPVLPTDDVDTLWERIKIQERELYPRVLQGILDGTIDLDEIRRRR